MLIDADLVQANTNFSSDISSVCKSAGINGAGRWRKIQNNNSGRSPANHLVLLNTENEPIQWPCSQLLVEPWKQYQRQGHHIILHAMQDHRQPSLCILYIYWTYTRTIIVEHHHNKFLVCTNLHRDRAHLYNDRKVWYPSMCRPNSLLT